MLVLRSLVVLTGLAREAWPWAGPWPWEREAPGDYTSRFEARLAPARQLLAGYRRIGYASPVPNSRLLGLGAADATWHFFLAQYVLTPVVISRDPTVTPWLANFPTAEALEGFAAARGAVIRWQSGGLGIVVPRTP